VSIPQYFSRARLTRIRSDSLTSVKMSFARQARHGRANRQNPARPALRGLEGRPILCVLFDLVFDGRAWKGEKKLAHEI
jgi:hypothetical protein